MTRSKQTEQSQTNILHTLVIILLWLLIKIGQIEFAIIKAIWTTLKWIILSPIKISQWCYSQTIQLINRPKQNSPRQVQAVTVKKSQHRHFIIFNRRRGRPRTQPFLRFYGKKVVKFLDLVFPKPLRIGVLVIILSLLVFGYSLFLVTIAHDLPDPHRLSQTQTPLTNEFYDRNGVLLYKLYEDRNRSLVNLSELPSYVINATIAIEDKNFFTNPGFDLFGIVRALIADLKHEDIQGGSTLTQQLIKNTLLTPDRTWTRKVQEVLLAFWAQQIFSKNDILKMYLDEIPYGGNTLGIEAASEMYFGKKAKELTLAQAAYLAGLIASPTTYSPYGSNPNLSKERQKEVLRRMVEDGYITQDEADKATADDLAIKPYVPSIQAPHFVMYVREYLEEKYGSRFLAQGGLKIITTLDLDLQHRSENIVAEEVAKLTPLNVTNGAAMIEDPRTGQILAMVGSVDYYNKNFGAYNVALALRQPGSSIKPVTYATAFKSGLTPGTIILDTPTKFNDGVNIYAPVNYDGTFHGPVTIRTALGSSYNIPAVKTLAIVGIPSMLQTAKELGITTLTDPSKYGLSLTLGAGEVKLIDMMTVYSTFSQLGTKHLPTPIVKITDAQGSIIEDNSQNSGFQVLDPGVAYMITDVLADQKAKIPAFGANSLLVIPGHTVAVKTGTTDDKKDNWTLGYTPEVTVGVWVGNNDGTPMNPALSSGITGAAPIWNRLMTILLKDKPDLAFVKPDNVTTGTVDGKQDLVLSNQEVKSITKVVTPTPSPEEKDKNSAITFTDPFSTFTQDQPQNPPDKH